MKSSTEIEQRMEKSVRGILGKQTKKKNHPRIKTNRLTLFK